MGGGGPAGRAGAAGAYDGAPPGTAIQVRGEGREAGGRQQGVGGNVVTTGLLVGRPTAGWGQLLGCAFDTS